MLVYPTPEIVADQAAAFVVRCRDSSLAARGRFTLVVSGGRTPVMLLQRLVSMDWSHTLLLLADERAVPYDHPDSNLLTLRQHLLDPLGASAPTVLPLPADADPEALARLDPAYEAVDLLVLGIGEDGHLASLFPGSPLLRERQRRLAVVTDSPKPPALRTTLTPRVLEEAREILVLASGAGKADAARRALANTLPQVPAALVRHRTWLLDQAAVS